VESRENITKDLIAGLNSPDENVVVKTIDELRTHGNIHVLPTVFKLLFSKRMETINFSLVDLINDIKDPAAVPVFMDAIRMYRGKSGFEQLVSACWQCGLDFSAHIDTFIELVIEDSYYTALEAFSVIEENVSLLSSQQRTARIELIRSRMEYLSPEKRLLVNELLSMMSTVSGPLRLDPDYMN